MKTKIEVRYQAVIGKDKPELDEVLLWVKEGPWSRWHLMLHLEQMDDTTWCMNTGSGDQRVRVILATTRARIRASWTDEGDCPVTVSGRESVVLPEVKNG